MYLFALAASLVGMPAPADQLNIVVSFLTGDDRTAVGIDETSIKRRADGAVDAVVVTYTKLPDTAAVEGLALTKTVPSWARTMNVRFDCARGVFMPLRQVMYSDTWHVVVDMPMTGEVSPQRPVWKALSDHVCSAPQARATKKLASHKGLNAFAEAGKSYFAAQQPR